jgi:lysozyme family protein
VLSNYDEALHFVWAPGRDNPRDGYHVTPGDPGGGTCGGVTEATWARAVADGLVSGTLRTASLEDLSLVLRRYFWGSACDAMPSGIDLLVFNGCMMTGYYAHLLQQCLGMIGASVDGMIGKQTLSAIRMADADTLIDALTGVHYAYLTRLPTWPRFGAGWASRVEAAGALASLLSTRALLPPKRP